MTSQRTHTRPWWLLPAGLISLSAIPMVFGAVRLGELATGAEITPDNARFFASPAPVVLHIVSATVYSIVGAFQFSSRLRRIRPVWHRVSGRFLVVSGLMAALTGLWMTHFYALPELDGELLYAFRMAFGLGMVVAITAGFVSIRRRDFASHRAWMMRGYAIGLGAGTQVFTHLPWALAGATPDELSRALAMGAGWAINLAVAEWYIRRRTRDVVAAPPAAEIAAHTSPS